MKIQKELLTKSLCREMLYLLNEAKLEVYKENDSLYQLMKSKDYKESNIDFDYFLNSQRKKTLAVYTVREENNKLIGHFTLNISSHQQCKDVRVASCENVIITKNSRSFSLFKKLYNFVEEDLIKSNVDLLQINIDYTNKRMHKLLKYFSMNEKEIMFTKELRNF